MADWDAEEDFENKEKVWKEEQKDAIDDAD